MAELFGFSIQRASKDVGPREKTFTDPTPDDGAIELWSNGINGFATNTGVIAPADYQTDLTVEQLDRDEAVLKTYILRNCWPTNSGSAIELSMDTESTVEEFSVTWRYQYFDASGVSI